MPTYAYRCPGGHEFETVQGITHPPLSTCPTCGEPVRRVVFPVGIVFKGQGFYKTDSRSSSTGSIAPVASSSSEKSSTPDKNPKPNGQPADGAAPKSSKTDTASGGVTVAGATPSAGEKHG
ncbi:MAG: FmdB family zinc ribbon protein [Candidatus Dormibacteria bacterium]